MSQWNLAGVELQGPPLSTKGPFVQFDLANSKLSGSYHKNPLDLDHFYNPRRSKRFVPILRLKLCNADPNNFWNFCFPTTLE